MLESNTILQIINKPFTNLIYTILAFYTNYLKTNSEGLDKGEIPFSKDLYSYIKTKDHKHIGIANLEPKFQKNFISIIEKIQLDDNKDKQIDEDNKDKPSYGYDTISDLFSEHNRDELFLKVYSI